MTSKSTSAENNGTLSWFERCISTGWGFSEATFFIIVPDVYLTVLAVRGIRRGLVGSIWCLGGALIGGMCMFLLGAYYAEWVFAVFELIPSLDLELIQTVRHQVKGGIESVILGPLLGLPYKIYAAEAGRKGVSLWYFMLLSVPARYLRFLLSVVIAGGLCHWFRKNEILDEAGFQKGLLLFWIAFYIVYFTVR